MHDKQATDAQDYYAWLVKCRSHHEYAEFVERLEMATSDFIEGFVLKQAWRAATWSKEHHQKEWMATIFRELDAGNHEPDLIFYGAQHGPFIFLTKVLNPRIKLPTNGTMLAAQLVSTCSGMKHDWRMFALLLEIAGIASDVDPESLRVSARKLLKLLDSCAVQYAGGWPQDVGVMTWAALGAVRSSEVKSTHSVSRDSTH